MGEGIQDNYSIDSNDLNAYRNELISSVCIEATDLGDTADIEYSFVNEMGYRLSNAEEFQEFIPCHYSGSGQRGKKVRVDGYEIDEADGSVRLMIADYSGSDELQTIIKTRAESLFSQLASFIDESVSGRIWTADESKISQVRELSRFLELKGASGQGVSNGISRYRLYLFTDKILSDRVKDVQGGDIGGIPVEYHIWDISRLYSVSQSPLGTEELIIDFNALEEGGLPCLHASSTDDYDGYLCVIKGDVLAELYDLYGGKLLEGNVRAFLGTSRDINKRIQGTIRSEPSHFFSYNNGISATAINAEIAQTDLGARLMKVKFLQIVNGGQTTASLHVAKKKDKADLRDVHVQMKLSVVKSKGSESLDSMIQNIARYSNSQNKVSDADFFSNHPFHRAIERRSRTIKAPPASGAQYNTYWFYERARGQYGNGQSQMSLREKKDFQRENPRAQLISKTDLAKYENSWMGLPYYVSQGAQKNFKEFAKYIEREFGDDGIKFNNDYYFKSVIAKAIVFKFSEHMVSAAKTTWYGGDYRAQIVTYTLAKLANLVDKETQGLAVNLNMIWDKQGVSPALAAQLESIAKVVSREITSPPVPNMNVGEWCKKEECWQKVKQLHVELSTELMAELILKAEAKADERDGAGQGRIDADLNAEIEVVQLAKNGVWKRLKTWNESTYPTLIVGKDADLLRNAAEKQSWVPSSARHALQLIKALRNAEQSGFKL